MTTFLPSTVGEWVKAKSIKNRISDIDFQIIPNSDRIDLWIEFMSQKGTSYVIESSTDLLKWNELETILGTGQVVRIESDRENILKEQFFRVRVNN